MKVERARQFIDELAAELDRYSASEPYSVETKVVGGVPGIRIRFEGVGHRPGAILGDALHSLRTALDQTASELARINGRNDNDVYFPFSDKPETFERAISRKNFHKAGDDAVALLRQLKPYRGGNDDLRAIHDLDNQDKHTTLIVAGNTHALEIEGSYDVDNPLAGAFEISGSVTWDFPDGTSLAGRDILSTLKELVEMVKGIIEAFASLVVSRA